MKKVKFVCQLLVQKIGNLLPRPIKVFTIYYFNCFLFNKTINSYLLIISVIQALIALVNDPEPEHPLRAELAEEYLKDRKKFFKNAEDYAKKFGEKRPSD